MSSATELLTLFGLMVAFVVLLGIVEYIKAATRQRKWNRYWAQYDLNEPYEKEPEDSKTEEYERYEAYLNLNFGIKSPSMAFEAWKENEEEGDEK